MLLRAPQMADFAEWAALREASRDFLTPWEPTWPADDLTRAAFRRRLRRYAEDQRADPAYPFFVFRKTDDALVGGLTLANIRRGVAQAGSLGYWMGAAVSRAQGYMTAAVRALVPFAFGALRLHRHRGRLHPGQRGLDPAAGEDRLHARGLCARNISASTGSGRTTCCMRGCTATAERIRGYVADKLPWDGQGSRAITKLDHALAEGAVGLMGRGLHEDCVMDFCRHRRPAARRCWLCALLVTTPASAQNRSPTGSATGCSAVPSSAPGAPATPTRAAEVECPGVDVRQGASTLAITAPGTESWPDDHALSGVDRRRRRANARRSAAS